MKAGRIPVLQTERLTLREHRIDDFPAYEAFYASDATVFMGGPRGAYEAWRRFTSDVGQWALAGHGWWTIEHDDKPVGFVGVQHPPSKADMALGWVVYPDHQGQGFALEAARTVRIWSQARLQPERLVSYIEPSNTASIRVAEKLGARLEGHTAPHDPEVLVYVHAEDAG